MNCSKCGSGLAPGARFCGNCAAPASILQRSGNPGGSDAAASALGGCLGLAVIIGIGYVMLSMCSSPSKTPEQVKAEQVEAAENDRKGFNCLSGWDGSNRSLVDQIKSQLRNPDSFQHVETTITPDQNGKHLVTMTYRAQNGFGGMNVETAMAEVDHRTCAATIISTGDEQQ